jgi:hypothetical protein
VTLAVEHDEAANPPDVRFLSPSAVVTQADRTANLVEQPWRLTFHDSDERPYRANTGGQRFGWAFVLSLESAAGISANGPVRGTQKLQRCDCQPLIRDSFLTSDSRLMIH